MKKNIKKNSISTIIFDVDGILVDTVSLHFRAWQKAFKEEGILFEKPEYQKINGIPRDAGIQIILQNDASPDRILKIGNRKQRYYLDFLTKTPPQPLPGITYFLSQARQAGLRIAAASSSKNAVTVLTAAQLIACFDVVVTGYDFQYPKPHPDIFLTTSTLLGVDPALTLVVEDAVNGVTAAIVGGFYCVAVANSESTNDLYAAGASIVVPTTNELTLDLFHKISTA